MSGQERLSLIRCSFHDDCIDAVNRQIHMEVVVQRIYMSMSRYFEPEGGAQDHFSKYFKELAVKEKTNIRLFVHLQFKRRAEVHVPKKVKPRMFNWENGLNAMEYALALEKRITSRISRIFKLATERNDHQLCKFLQNYFLPYQAMSVKEVENFVTKLREVPITEPTMADNLLSQLMRQRKKE